MFEIFSESNYTSYEKFSLITLYLFSLGRYNIGLVQLKLSINFYVL